MQVTECIEQRPFPSSPQPLDAVLLQNKHKSSSFNSPSPQLPPETLGWVFPVAGIFTFWLDSELTCTFQGLLKPGLLHIPA